MSIATDVHCPHCHLHDPVQVLLHPANPNTWHAAPCRHCNRLVLWQIEFGSTVCMSAA
ncbi:MAG TPA: hypothetical protein VGO93_22145 [Candidatus Xenobia bacterium]